MRQIFSSMRVENVERLAQIMREDGIEVQITNGRSYRSGRRRVFNYRDTPPARQQPALWVVRSEDQARARQLMRDIGMPGPTTRPITDSYLSSADLPPITPEKPQQTPRQRKIMRYRRLLLVAIAILAALVIGRSF
ncbi:MULTISPECIES: pathogenicity-like protein [unclassified Luteimonas]